MATIPELRLQDVSPGHDFHAALVTSSPRSPGATRHTHDFWEMMYVVEDGGTHWVADQVLPLRAGDLLWIRPSDTHAVCGRVGERLHFLNVAFSAQAWGEFRLAAHLEAQARAWDAPALPPTVSLPAAQRAPCAEAFGHALHAFHSEPSRLALCRFWGEALPLLRGEAVGAKIVTEGMPPWLARACQALEQPGDLADGVPRLVELAGVSPAHLSRVLRSCTGQTPTEWVNALRLRRARTLLLTTSQGIAQIALDCGFDNLSYFYRRFGQAYGRSPHALRREARRGVMPGR